MKKLISTFIICFTALLLSAQDYSVTFSASGESSEVSTITVENLTQKKSMSLNGKDVLRLVGTVTRISDMQFEQTGIQIFPNPMEDYSFMEFSTTEREDVIIELFDLAGRKLYGNQEYLSAGRHRYRITGIGEGLYVLKVKTGSQSYSGRLTSHLKTGGLVDVTYQKTLSSENPVSALKNANAEKQMQYNNGDVIMFRALGGVHKSVVVKIITGNTHLEFPFYKCEDPDNRNYATIKIGNQVWMAENYAYLPSISSSASSSATLPHYYVYGNTFKTVAGAKSQDNYKTYGVLYNWPAAKADQPSGWHLPSIGELEALEKYLEVHGFADGHTIIGDYYLAKSIAATTNWNSSAIPKSIGNNQLFNNKSGFSALPGGQFNLDGEYKSVGESGYWWNSFEENVLSIIYVGYYTLRYDYTYNFNKIDEPLIRSKGFSVRYIKN